MGGWFMTSLPEQILNDTFQKNQLLLDLDLIRSRKRTEALVMHRKICCMALYKAGYSLNLIGDILSRSHCAVYHLIHNSPFTNEFSGTRFLELDRNTKLKVQQMWSRKQVNMYGV